MKFNLPLCTCLLFLTTLATNAAPILITGTPGDDLLATPTGPSPNLNNILLTYSTLTAYSTFNSYTSQGVTVSSPDGLEVEPFSTQSNPNELYDEGTNGDFDGTANITISVLNGVSAIGVGIADSDDIAGTDTPVPITLEALGLGGVDLGSVVVTITELGPNPGNGYFVFENTIPNLYGLQITETDGDTSGDYSGLAIADVQVSPEPSSLVLLFGGLAMIGVGRLRKKA